MIHLSVFGRWSVDGGLGGRRIRVRSAAGKSTKSSAHKSRGNLEYRLLGRLRPRVDVSDDG